ncbi:MAG: hypothetical protein A2293_04905 [Elusimicrobia bacterium RIFOXYB2_FULL_49_7]|nr:MAG: hypothetical protein A2293_04905 [Elusimicrobia bacterium RIFOXYB2_FULL_49_7]
MHLTQEMLNDFLTQGQIKGSEEISAHLSECADCRNLFSEMLFVDQLLSANAKPVILSDESWNQCVDTVLEEKDDLTVLSDSEWDTLAASVLAETSQSPQTMIRHQFFPSARWPYALAATLLIAIGLYFIYKPTSVLQISQSVVVTAPTDSIPVERPPLGRSIIINDKSRVLPSLSADIRILRSNEREVLIRQTTGAALFSITPHAFNSFVVEMNDLSVRVTGTVFETWIQDNGIQVTVLRGSINVRHPKSGAVAQVAASQVLNVVKGRLEVRSLGEKQLHLLESRLSILSGIKVKPSIVSSNNAVDSLPVTAVSTFIDQSEEWLNNGMSLMGKQDYGPALEWFEKVKANATGTLLETAWFKSACLKAGPLGRSQEGIEDLSAYVKTFPRGVFTEEALIELVKLHRGQNNEKAMLQNEQRYLSFFINGSHSQDFLYEAATILREKERQYDEARIYYRVFTERFPDDNRTEDALFWLGKCLLSLERRAEAKTVFDNYLVKYPSGRWATEIRTFTD